MRLGMVMGAIACASPALAQDGGRASDRALAPLVACRPIADVRARAACYDSALDRLQRAVSDRQVVVMDREQVSVDRRAQFGFNGSPRPPRQPIIRTQPARPAPPEIVNSVDSTVASSSPTGYELWIVRLANGSVWRTTEAGLQPPRAGADVHIRRGAIGSYMLRIGKGRAIRAVRIG